MDHLAAAKVVVKTLSDAGFVAYFAGGWVRDFLLKHPSDDIDIATSARAEEVQTLFSHTIPVGIAFGIVIVVCEGHHFEVATFRSESGYLDGRRPTEIAYASAKEDASRRDFTINGMFWDPLAEKLYDFVGGQQDLKKKVIRAIGDAHERFLEDRLRMMRAIRYATRFDFEIDETTLSAISSHAPTLLPAVAMERVWQEFKKMSHFAHFDEGLILLHETGLLGVIFPSLKEKEIKTLVQPISKMPKEMPAIGQILLLFLEDDLQQIEELCEYLKVSADERKLALFLHETHQLFSMPKEWQMQLEDAEWVKWYANPYSEWGLYFGGVNLAEHAKRQERLSRFIARARDKNPVVKAEHLIQEGIKPGKTLGLLLQESIRISVNEKLEDPQAVIALLKQSTLWP